MSHVAAEIGIGAQLLGRWVQQAVAAGGAAGGRSLNVDERAELERLRKENADLRLARSFLKAAVSVRLLRVGPAQSAPASPGAVRRAGLDAKVAAFHAASDAVYGSPRILADLRQDGETVSRKTVAASMRRQRLQGISPRRFTPVTTIADNGRANPADLVTRTWDTGRLDAVWTSDIEWKGRPASVRLMSECGWRVSPEISPTLAGLQW